MPNPYGALQFDATASVVVSHHTDFNFGSSDCAIDITFKLDDLTAHTIITKWAADIGWKLYYDNGLKLALNATVFSFSDVLTIDTWYRFHVSIKGSTAYIFLNEERKGTIAVTASISNSQDITIGQFIGAATEVRLSTRFREVDVTYRYLPKQFDDDQWTVLLLHFNEGAFTATVYDMSTKRHNGVMTNANFIEGPYIVEPVAVTREQVWLAIDSSALVSDYLSARLPNNLPTKIFDGKYRFRPGDYIAPTYTLQNTPALVLVPTSLPSIDPVTSAYHKMIVPINIKGYLYARNVNEISYFWFITLKAIWMQYQVHTTAGRFNWIAIQDARSQGPSFEIQETNDGLFSSFDETIQFTVNHDFLS